MLLLKNYTGADGKALRYGELRANEAPATSEIMLFVPGLGGSVKGALRFLEPLQEQFKVIYGPDLRGFGINLFTPEQPPLFHTNDLLADLNAFYETVMLPEIEASQGNRQIVLCGISLGGVLATLLAERYPERYRVLILLAPAYKPHPRAFSLAYTLRALVKHLLQRQKARVTLPYGVKSLTQNPLILEDPQYAELPPIQLSPGFLLGVASLGKRAVADMKTLRVPTLMIVPGQDLVCDPAAMRRTFQKLPVATLKKLVEFPDFYHDILFENEQEAILQAVLAWCDQSPSSTIS